MIVSKKWLLYSSYVNLYLGQSGYFVHGMCGCVYRLSKFRRPQMASQSLKDFGPRFFIKMTKHGPSMSQGSVTVKSFDISHSVSTRTGLMPVFLTPH